jgi:pyridoxal phosphate enzyme (YggS family)
MLFYILYNIKEKLKLSKYFAKILEIGVFYMVYLLMYDTIASKSIFTRERRFRVEEVFVVSSLSYIKRNHDELLEELEKIAARVGVLPPKLVSVTKSGSDGELAELFRIGAEAMGENRPGELKRRAELLSDMGMLPELHQIGTLQSNKVKLIAERVTLIHSLDSLSLAKEIDRQAKKYGRTIPVLIEINSGREPQKSGIMPEDAERFYEEVRGFSSLGISGLMTMGPADCAVEELRSYFRSTRMLFDRMNEKYGFGENPILSMGMSDSYEIAIEEGSTLVRVGRRLFKKD